MIPLKRFAAYRGIPASSLIPAEQLDKVAADTMVGGATSPRSSAPPPGLPPALLLPSVWLPCSATRSVSSPAPLFSKENMARRISASVCPVSSAATASKKIVDFNLNDEELALFHKSAEAVHKTNAALPC